MVPKSISVEACFLNRAKEQAPIDPSGEGKYIEPVRDRIYLGKVFELNAQHVRAWANITEDRLPAASIKIPASLAECYQARLLTKIVVYGQICLDDYNSSLNLPQQLPGKPNFVGGETLQFHYQLGAYPGLGYEIVNPDEAIT